MAGFWQQLNIELDKYSRSTRTWNRLLPPALLVLPQCSRSAHAVLPLKRPCSLARTEVVTHDRKFGVYIIYIYIYPAAHTYPWSSCPLHFFSWIKSIRDLGYSVGTYPTPSNFSFLSSRSSLHFSFPVAVAVAVVGGSNNVGKKR